jgi:hypothetical protein
MPRLRPFPSFAPRHLGYEGLVISAVNQCRFASPTIAHVRLSRGALGAFPIGSKAFGMPTFRIGVRLTEIDGDHKLIRAIESLFSFNSSRCATQVTRRGA